MKKILLLLAILIVPVCLQLVTPICAFAESDVQSAACQAGNPLCNQGSDDPINETIGKITKFIALIGGFVAVVIIIISGIKFTTSNGDPQKAASARNGVIYAVIGLIVIVAAQAIILFILNRV